MTFAFSVLGFVLIWCLFYLKFNSSKRLCLFLGVLIIFLGMFLPNAFIKNISINFCIFAGYLLILLSLIPSNRRRILKIFENASFGVVIYVCLNLISLDFNSFFNCIPLAMIVLVLNALNYDIKHCFFGVNFSLGLCEIFNLFFMLKKMNFSTIFSFEFINCFVICNAIMLLLVFIVEIFKRKSYEKGC